MSDHKNYIFLKIENIKIYLLFTFLLLLPAFALTQDEVLMQIGNKSISLGEFERLYQKNNPDNSINKHNIEEYLERFIDFKLKVIEAENLKLDTTTAFLSEFKKYRKELIKPFMVDSLELEMLLRHSYEKSLKEINASHILVSLGPSPSPSDTLKAWTKIMEIRRTALDGADFGTLARNFSDDPSAINNEGNLGWFSSFRMVYEFEEAAYSTPVGEISMPVRTRFGYHLIKVNDIRPAQGSVQLAHIFLLDPEDEPRKENESKKDKIFAIKDSLNMGIPFEDLAMKYSEDKSSAEQGGLLQWFNIGMMIKELEHTAYNLKNIGDISDPVKTSNGWHILKLLNKKLPGDYEEERPELLKRVKSPAFSDIDRKIFVERIKDKYGFNLDQKNLEEFYNLVGYKIFKREGVSDQIPEPELNLFTVGDKKVSMGEFAEWIENSSANIYAPSPVIYVNDEFEKFVYNILYDYEESFVPDRYPELKYIIEEYHDGILLFDLTEKMVWNKAVEDSVGLEEFFNKNYSDYRWDKRAEAFIITTKDNSRAEAAESIIKKYGKKNIFDKEFLHAELCPEDTLDECFDFTGGKYEKGENSLVDKLKWKAGAKQKFENSEGISIVFIRKILKPEYKTIDETRGLVISDYQDYLEKQWVAELRKKYPVQINRDILSQIY